MRGAWCARAYAKTKESTDRCGSFLRQLRCNRRGSGVAGEIRGRARMHTGRSPLNMDELCGMIHRRGLRSSKALPRSPGLPVTVASLKTVGGRYAIGNVLGRGG